MTPTRIFIALDPQRVAPETIELGHALGLATEAPLTLLAVWHWWEPVELAMLAGTSVRDEAKEVLRAVGDGLRTRGHDAVERVTAAGSVGSGLHDAGQHERTGLLVLGPAHRGAVGRVLVGSTAATFLHGAPCPVAVPPRDYHAPQGALGRIGVAFVDTEDGHEALRGAAALARRAGAQLRILAVAELGVPPEALVMPGYGARRLVADRHEAAESATQRAAQSLQEGLDVETVVIDGDPVSALTTASTDLDLLVCGSRSYGPLAAVMFGSVSGRLLHRAASPLLVIPRGRERRLESLLENSSTAGLAR
ncbi:MAG: universal stress protein [Solirubrobacteraceae bacterium]